MEEIEIEIYKAQNGKRPFKTWLLSLDRQVRKSVLTRIARIRLGNLGDCKRLSNANGLFELRIMSGPGYRVYFGRRGKKIVVLLSGSSKKDQTREVGRAVKYWQDYQDS